MYVDDLMGCCHIDDLQHELDTARRICNGLLGEGAVEESKTSHGRQQDFIGWQFNLDRESVAVARHNYLKTLNGMMTLDTNRGVGVRDIQRVASWASRYSAICRSLKPFTQDLFDMVKGKKTHARIVLDGARGQSGKGLASYATRIKVGSGTPRAPIAHARNEETKLLNRIAIRN
jgi:hypothetical protein